MFESVGFRLFNLAGVPAPVTHWVLLRIITEAEENPTDRRWEVIPWDIDLTWADNMFGSGELTNYAANITIPAKAVTGGHTYRARVRMKDVTGRWSHWSAPVQFVAQGQKS